MRITLWTVLTAALAAMFITTTSGPSFAQSTPRLEELQIDFWPEFDQPDMLVIYRGRLSADTPLPATLTLRLPARVEAPHAVAYDDGTGNLFEASHSTAAADEGLMVTLETPTPNFQLEFYDSLTRIDERRSYAFVWPGDYAIDQLNLLLLPPSGATDVMTEPEMSPVQRGTNSFSYVGSLDGLIAGQETQVTVSYRRVVTDIGATAPPPIDEDDINVAPIAGSIVAALALVVGAGLWYTRREQSRRTRVPSVQRRRPKSKRISPESAIDQRPRSAAGFCTQCGGPLRAEDRFCSQCGTPVQRRPGATD